MTPAYGLLAPLVTTVRVRKDDVGKAERVFCEDSAAVVVDTAWGLTPTQWTAASTVVAGLALVVALGIGVASTRAAFKAAGAAEQAARAAEMQGRVLTEQLATQYPVLQADVSGQTLEQMPQPGVVLVSVLHGGIAATEVEAWLFWSGIWMKGEWPAVSPNLSVPGTQTVNVPVHQVAALEKRQTPFGDFQFDGGMVGVVWCRPDGIWRFGRGIDTRDLTATDEWVMGRMANARSS